MAMSDYQFIRFETDGKLGILTLNREDKLNALNIEVLNELRTFLEDLHKNNTEKIQGLVFTGAGEKAFIAGADIASMSDMDEKAGEEFAHLGQQVTFLFEELPFPVIAAVNGYALGGGCEIALSCDFIYATTNAMFGLPEVSLGLIPGFGGTQRLAKIIGRNKAKEAIYTGRMIKADEAYSLGLAIKICETKDDLVAAAKETLLKALKNSPYAIGVAKSVMNKGVDYHNEEGLRLERERFGAIFSSFDQKEGCKAFVEKRKPEFKGE